MSKTVFIIGAGVSKQAGAPLMDEFLDVANSLRQDVAKGDPDFDLVFRGRDALQAVHSKSTMDLLNMESVFAAFEMAKLLRRLGTLSVEDVDALPRAMTHVIPRTIEATVTFPVDRERILPPHPYAEIGQLHRYNKQTHRPPSYSFITFNYDICLDYALHFNSLPIDYCLGQPSPGAIKLLKLHGSLNWSRCPKCKEIVPLTMGEYFGSRIRLLDVTSVKIPISLELRRVSHCDGTLGDPFIAPPTWNKTQYHAQLDSVWSAAARELSEAESIVICGYSLPETDQFFRYLYALGTVGGAGLRRFWVINPDPHLEQRFRNLCGPQALRRFEYFPSMVEDCITNLIESLD